MEAAGIEPASEKARPEKNYVRFRFGCFGRRLGTGKRADSLVRLDLGLPAPDRSFETYPAR